MTRAFDAAMRAVIAACALFAPLATVAAYLCATVGMPCRTLYGGACPVDQDKPAIRGTLL